VKGQLGNSQPNYPKLRARRGGEGRGAAEGVSTELAKTFLEPRGGGERKTTCWCARALSRAKNETRKALRNGVAGRGQETPRGCEAHRGFADLLFTPDGKQRGGATGGSRVKKEKFLVGVLGGTTFSKNAAEDQGTNQNKTGERDSALVRLESRSLGESAAKSKGNLC